MKEHWDMKKLRRPQFGFWPTSLGSVHSLKINPCIFASTQDQRP